MWLFTKTGFYSINRTPDHQRLQLRSRRRGDLDRFRDKYCPALGPVLELAGTDYEYRAEVEVSDLIVGLAQAAQDIDYRNFKDAVYYEDVRRHRAYFDVWMALARGLSEKREDEDDETES